MYAAEKIINRTHRDAHTGSTWVDHEVITYGEFHTSSDARAALLHHVLREADQLATRHLHYGDRPELIRIKAALITSDANKITHGRITVRVREA